MSVVIGAGTTANLGTQDCVASVNWSLSPNTQRLYCLGSWDPFYSIYKPTENMSMTIYSPGPDYNTEPTQSCIDANQISAAVDPAACGDPVNGMSGDFFVNSYNYSKDDAQLPGQESWSLTRWVSGGGAVLPDYTIRGISEGSGTPNSGIVFSGVTTTSTTGSVSAGSIGRADEVEAGVVVQVGGGSTLAGETGTGSVSIPYTPLWV
ncbi:MAG: hypothetical protein ACTSV7_06695 [Candidatus Baldrarchaeia archaeon]